MKVGTEKSPLGYISGPPMDAVSELKIVPNSIETSSTFNLSLQGSTS